MGGGLSRLGGGVGRGVGGEWRWKGEVLCGERMIGYTIIVGHHNLLRHNTKGHSLVRPAISTSSKQRRRVSHYSVESCSRAETFGFKG